MGTNKVSYITLKYVVTRTKTYNDLMLGQQAFYPIDFGHDNWTEKAWLNRPNWSLGNGQMEFVLVDFCDGPWLLQSGRLGGNVGVCRTSGAFAHRKILA